MSIVGGLFRAAGLGTLVDALESQGVIRAGERALPTTTPEMFIGDTGVQNLGKAGLFESDNVLGAMRAAEKDRLGLTEEQWNERYGPMSFAYDDPANKTMLEISDRNVNFKKGIDLNKLSNKDYYGFDEIFDAKLLKQAYPELGDMKILLNDNPANPALAGFDPENNVIEFNRKSRAWNSSDPMGSALHEIQHYVQQRENLTQGESFSGVLQQNSTFQDSATALQDKIAASPTEVIKFVKQNPGLGFKSDDIAEALGSLVARDGLSAKTALERAFKSKEKAEKFLTRAKKSQVLDDILFLKDVNTAAYNTAAGDYMRVAGETFARQTDQRRLLSPEERVANPAMEAIDKDRVNKLYDINTMNLTPSSSAVPYKGPIQDAYFVPDWKLKEQTREEQQQGLGRKLNNPIKLKDGSRLSGFTSNSQEVFYGYDKNGEVFTIRPEYINPDDIVGSRDSNKTAEMIKQRLPIGTAPVVDINNAATVADPFAPQVPQSTIPGI